MPITSYRQEQGELTAGTPKRFNPGRDGLTFLNPHAPQVDEITITTGDAGTWSITVTTATLPDVTVAFTPAGASTAEAATALRDAWNADPDALIRATAVLTGAAVVELRYRDDQLAYTSAVTPSGAGAETTVVAAASGFTAHFGHWAFHTLVADIGAAALAEGTDLFRRLVSPVGSNLLTNVAGIVVKALGVENPPANSGQLEGGYPSGIDVPVMRRGNIMVPVTVDVRPGDPVHAIITGADAGKTTNTGALDVSSIASFYSSAAAGGVAEVKITLT